MISSGRVQENGSVRDSRSLLLSMRRLNVIADRASDPEDVMRALARELLASADEGTNEVLVHHLGDVDDGRGEAEPRDLVVIYLFDGDGRLSWWSPRSERPAAVSWVANTGRSFVAEGERELRSGAPKLASGPVAARSALLIPLVLRGEVTAVIVLGADREGAFGDAEVEQSSALVDQAATALALVEARAEAGTDAVTGCMNHRAMRRRLQEEVSRAGRTGGRLSCLLIDLDDFKLVNDVYGHPSGDAVLRGVSECLMGEFRAFDRVARYGGDEFVVILPEADVQSAIGAGERALSTLASFKGPAGGIAASIGVAEWREGMSMNDLLAACDEALLHGKRSGKARVMAAT